MQTFYENAKAADAGAAASSLRYALVELENVHDPAQVFHPIHRIVRNIDPEDFVKGLRNLKTSGFGQILEVPVLTADREEILQLPAEDPAPLLRPR